MGLPAARITDEVDHRHASGDILEGSPNVTIGGLRAARVGDKVKHGWGTEVIVEGEPTVTINGLFAARMTDAVSCGGHISTGCGTVTIGHARGRVVGNVQAGQKMCIAAAKGRKNTLDRMLGGLKPTQQSYNNCGVESARQIINQATGKKLTEDELLQAALDDGLADRGDPTNVPPGSPPRKQDGITIPEQRQAILGGWGDYSVDSTIEASSLDNISQALSSGKGVIADVDAHYLWENIPGIKQPNFGAFHAVTITGIEYDSNGNIVNIIINDTGTGQCSRRVPVDTWNKAVQGVRDAKYTPSINVTDKPIF